MLVPARVTRGTILFMAANPNDTVRLQLDEEARNIAAKIRASEYRDSLDLVAAWAVRPDDVIQKLNESKPLVVHFSGHGCSNGDIVLMDQHGKLKRVRRRALASLFAAIKDNIRLVVFNACDSLSAAKEVVRTIDCAIGMKAPISDEAAAVFSASLYRAIGFGRSIRDAFQQGRAALLLEGIDEDSTPVLVARDGVDPSQVYLLPESSVSETPQNVVPHEQKQGDSAKGRWASEVAQMQDRIRKRRED
jgi:hypothetical protein